MMLLEHLFYSAGCINPAWKDPPQPGQPSDDRPTAYYSKKWAMLLVELFKRHGLDARRAPLVAIAWGLVFALLGRLAEIYPGFAESYKVAIVGVVAGLTAARLYSGQKALRGR